VISTHVLDTERGEPATGVVVELYRGDELVTSARTDGDGRVAELSKGPLEAGTYRLVFHPPSTFFRRIELEVAIDDPDRHYHVPLLVSPYSCASYRGS
jgi:5-hydroxyisourate hydrolase